MSDTRGATDEAVGTDTTVKKVRARHSYSIVEPFTAVEATSPPARVHARDEMPTGLDQVPRGITPWRPDSRKPDQPSFQREPR